MLSIPLTIHIQNHPLCQQLLNRKKKSKVTKYIFCYVNCYFCYYKYIPNATYNQQQLVLYYDSLQKSGVEENAR